MKGCFECKYGGSHITSKDLYRCRCDEVENKVVEHDSLFDRDETYVKGNRDNCVYYIPHIDIEDEDIEKIFDTCMEYRNKAEKYEKLETELGCPLEVRCKLYDGVKVFTNHNEVEVISTNKDDFDVHEKSSDFSFNLYYEDYKVTWWLKADRSE